jgi:hypothetical protein
MLEQRFHTSLTRIHFAVSMRRMKPQPKLSKKYAGRLGGLVGGKARAESLTPEKRKEIAKKAADARWSQKPKQNV